MSAEREAAYEEFLEQKPRVTIPRESFFAGWAARDALDQTSRVRELETEVQRLNSLINTPHTHDFLEAVRLEMPHQRERHGAAHDAGKKPADWFWLVGYLAGKALHALVSGNIEKAKHHVITTAAALGNWFLAITGESTVMRPGIEPLENG